MSKLTIDGAAFHGFGLIRRDPLTFLGVAILLTLLGGALAMVLIPAYARFFGLMMEIDQTAEPDPTVVFEAMSGLFGGVIALYALMIPVYAVAMGALYRSLVFGKSQGWILGLKLGMDELRSLLVTIVGYILAMAPYFGIVLVALIVGAVVAGVAAAGGGGSDGAAAIGAMVMGLLILVAYCVGLGMTIWVGIRLSYAAPASVGEKRFVIFESWRMTKGRFWTLFLAYLIVLVLFYAVELVVIGAVFAASSGWLATVDWQNIDFSVFETVSVGPTLIIGSIVYGLLATFIGAGFFGVASKGYTAWKEDAAQTPAST